MDKIKTVWIRFGVCLGLFGVCVDSVWSRLGIGLVSAWRRFGAGFELVSVLFRVGVLLVWSRCGVGVESV